MDTVGDYEYSTKDLIGQGAFAVVFKGRSKKDPTFTVAIKSITKKSLAKSQNLLGKEIKILQELTELHHENVVALLDCQEHPNHVYLVMEYCNGGDLADYLADKGTLSEDTIRIFLVQMAGAMKALFAKGIVHRDLKPQNILLSHSGKQKAYPKPSEIKLKIADFGFARFLQDGVMAVTLCGSPMYMAPEVIMSLKYDAKADLWSLGTIVFQCLTGKAAFHATTPQALKQYYEKNANLAPKIPPGTSPELCDLLTGLLKRNARERMNFDTFFNHKFLQRPQPQHQIPPDEVELPITNAYGTSPVVRPIRSSTPVKVETPPVSQPESPRSARTVLSSSPEDDFVLIPEHLTDSYSTPTTDKQMKLTLKSPPPPQPCGPVASPPRPSFLPITEPVPVPTQRLAYQRMQAAKREKNRESPKQFDNSIPRSQPINMKRSDNRAVQDIDISSLSPPSVQFVIGTPPGGSRRRTSSSSLCETPPQPNIWPVSPVSGSKLMQPNNSPLRRSGTSPPVMMGVGPLAKVPIFSPIQFENNNLRHPSFGLRTMTLPEISEMNNLPGFLAETTSFERHPIDFKPPDLEEETLLDKEHNETLAKINFVLTLSKCVLELAATKGAPIPFLVDGTSEVAPKSPVSKRAEQLVLMVKALQLLSSGLALASQHLKSGQLRPSNTVKNVVSTLNTKFRATLSAAKKLNSTGILSKITSSNITADKLIYDYAMQMCQNAALDELFGNASDCCQRYQTAQILLHSLSQQVQNVGDRELIKKYQDAVEKRLFVLQGQGYIYATDSN